MKTNPKPTHDGWLLDVYPNAEGITLWFLTDDDQRLCLSFPFPLTFYAAGPDHRLRQLAQYFTDSHPAARLERTDQKDLFSGSLPVLSIELPTPAALPALFKRVYSRFLDLDFYHVDIPLPVRFAHRTGVFPFTRCRVWTYENRLYQITPLESRWDIQLEPPPLRVMTLVPDTDPFYQPPRALTCEVFSNFRKSSPSLLLSLENETVFLSQLNGLIRKHDPDLIISAFGDTWLFPHLLTLAEKHQIPFNPNRDETHTPRRRAAFSYETYGRIEHRGEQVHLYGRIHLDHRNAAMYQHSDLLGAIEVSRLSALPLQDAARKSPGAGITAMQMLVALENDLLIPYQKGQVEDFKTPLELIRADRGGLVAQPMPGLHSHVAGIDFFSMYAQIMEHFNISPETVLKSSQHESIPAPELGVVVEQGKAGLVPQTVAPILKKRKEIKTQLAALDPRDCRVSPLQALATALKWLLLVGFGYMGYKRFRWGRIEAHETVTAFGRRALLQAKQTAESMGFEVIYFNVDGLYVKRENATQAKDFQPLLNAVEQATGLTIALDAVFDWIAFLPSRLNENVPVANRYFGLSTDSTGRPALKVRGLEIRCHNTPPFVSETQTALLDILAQTRAVDQLPQAIPALVQYLRQQLSALRAGNIPPEKLVCTQVLSREPSAYRVPSPGAKAAQQLEAQGKTLRPGQKVRFLHTRNTPTVWGLPDQPAPIDTRRYETLLIRAAANLFQPLGVNEETLKIWLLYPTQFTHPPKVYAESNQWALPLESLLSQTIGIQYEPIPTPSHLSR